MEPDVCNSTAKTLDEGSPGECAGEPPEGARGNSGLQTPGPGRPLVSRLSLTRGHSRNGRRGFLTCINAPVSQNHSLGLHEAWPRPVRCIVLCAAFLFCSFGHLVKLSPERFRNLPQMRWPISKGSKRQASSPWCLSSVTLMAAHIRASPRGTAAIGTPCSHGSSPQGGVLGNREELSLAQHTAPILIHKPLQTLRVYAKPQSQREKR